MRSYFSDGAKLLGIYLFSKAILNFWYLIASFIFNISDPTIFQTYTIASLISILGSLIIQFLFIYLLLFKTEKIMDYLKIKEETDINSGRKDILQPGIILIGIYLFSSKIGFFLGKLLFLTKNANLGRAEGTKYFGPQYSEDLLATAIILMISIFLILCSHIVIRAISPQKSDIFK